MRRRLRSLLGRSGGVRTLPAPRDRDRNGNHEGSPDRFRALSDTEPDAGHDIERRGATTRTPLAQRLNDVAVPRVVVFTVDAHASAEEAVRQLVQAGYRRAPLVLRDLDRPVGVIDLLDVMREGDRSVLHVARPALILSPDMEVADALREMRRRDAPMALVGDRYRGVTGIVTEKHLLERSAPASIRSARAAGAIALPRPQASDASPPQLSPPSLPSAEAGSGAEPSVASRRRPGPRAAAVEAVGSLRMPAGRLAVARRAADVGRLLGPGVIDTGMASLAGFVASAYAARFLPTADLGAYAMFFLAVMLIMSVPRALFATPSNVASLEWARRERLQLMSQALPAQAVMALLLTPLLAVPAILSHGTIDSSATLALTLTGAACMVLMPLQVEVLTILHLAALGWSAALASAARLIFSVSSILVLHFAGVEAVWIPFTAIALGNIGSVSVAALLVYRSDRGQPRRLPNWKHLLRSGRTLLPAHLVVPLGSFVVLAIVSRLASPEAVGHAEATRVVAMPVVVFASGIGAVLRPRLMESGRDREGQRAVRLGGSWGALTIATTAAYVVLIGWPHPFNPMSALIPAAYEVDGLAALRILGLAGDALSVIPGVILLGAGRNGDILLANSVRAGARVAVAAVTAPFLGAYAVPAAEATSEATGLGVGATRARRIFRGPARGRAEPAASGVAISGPSPLD